MWLSDTSIQGRTSSAVSRLGSSIGANFPHLHGLGAEGIHTHHLQPSSIREQGWTSQDHNLWSWHRDVSERISSYTGHQIDPLQSEQEVRRGFGSSPASGLTPIVYCPLQALSFKFFYDQSAVLKLIITALKIKLLLEYGGVLLSSADQFLITEARKHFVQTS